MKSKLYVASLVTIAILARVSAEVNAADVRVLLPGEVPKSRQQWEPRRSDLKRRILVATRLWPVSDRTPLNPVIHGRVERDDFAVNRVYSESCPGPSVTGLPFKPKHIAGRLPGVLCPHGHGGRLHDYGEKGIREQIVRGAGRFEGSGRYSKLARCARLARMGCVTFIFDMVSYADGVHISREVAHRFSKQRPGFDTKENWGFFAPQAESLYQGECLSDGQPLTKARTSSHPRAYAAYTFGYNHPLFAHLESYSAVDFLPGAVKYGDLPALLTLSVPQRLRICGETEESLGIVTAAYAASGQLQHLSIHERHPRDASAARVAQWLKQVKDRLQE